MTKLVVCPICNCSGLAADLPAHLATHRADRQALRAIEALLSGTHWTPDHVEEVARILQGAGYIIEEPDESC